MSYTSREIRLKSRPEGMPTAENFELASVAIPEPGEGELVVKNYFMSVDPYMRGRMRDTKSYEPPFQIGEVMTGGAVGEVVASNHNDYPVGSYVLSMNGWREFFRSSGKGLMKVDPELVPLSAYLGTAGMPGFTAYIGLLDIGEPQEGETVFVSAAAGAVGSVVCQIAKIKGCRVVGSAGSAQKVDWLLNTVGVDAAINYKEVRSLSRALHEQAPDGVDVYFENVGGTHLEAALNNMNTYGRIPVCGMISVYNATEPVPAPRNLSAVISKRLKLQGYIISDYVDRQPEFYAAMGQWIGAGEIKWEETVYEGIENAPEAFMGLFSGENMGKMLVKLAE